MPILSNVLLRADGQQLELTATDFDVTIGCSVQASVQAAGATTLPVKKLYGIVRELASHELEMDVDEKNTCSLRAGPSFYRMNGLPAEDFPPVPKFAENKKIKLPQEKLKALLRKTSFAISTDETRFVLNGIFVSLKEHKMSLVATDGRRLALADEEVELADESQGEFIVPTKAINELNRLLQVKGDVEMRFTENQAAFVLQDEKGASTFVISKLVEEIIPIIGRSFLLKCGAC